MKNFLQKNWIILGILILGAALRLYNFKELFMYTHDNDLSSWFVKDVLINKNLRLIGQETSTPGILIGGLFYYLLVPFYMLFDMSPVGGIFLVFLLGLLTIWSIYFVFTKVFNKNTGLIASFLYSISFYTVFNDREVVPTMPVILWTTWFLWALYLILKGNLKTGFLLTGLLAGLVWHLNMALIIVFPLVLVSIFFSQEKLKIKNLLLGVFVFIIISLPLILFEVRNNFVQVRALTTSLTTDQQDILSGFEKVQRVYYLMSKNFSAVVWGDYFDIPKEPVFLVFVLMFVVLIKIKQLSKNLGIILGLWTIIYFIFFSTYSKIVSEYYLNGTIIVFLAIVSLGLTSLMNYKKYKGFAIAFLVFLTIVNLDRFVTLQINRSGFVERMQIAEEIKKDSSSKGYSCVSISYITDPGYDRGYRYLFWLQKIKTKPISEKVPVYTVVFPLKDVFKTDKSFGAIGLIYPDYKSYSDKIVEESCQGEDFNLTNPMIGYN